MVLITYSAFQQPGVIFHNWHARMIRYSGTSNLFSRADTNLFDMENHVLTSPLFLPNRRKNKISLTICN